MDGRLGKTGAGVKPKRRRERIWFRWNPACWRRRLIASKEFGTIVDIATTIRITTALWKYMPGLRVGFFEGMR